MADIWLNELSEKDCIDRYFTVVGASSTLDHLDVKVSAFAIGGALVEISVIRRNGMLVGDRLMQEAVVPGSLFIAKKCLKLSKYKEETIFSSKNDFGAWVSNTSYSLAPFSVMIVTYKNCVSVDVRKSGAVVYSRIIYNAESAEQATELVSDWTNSQGAYDLVKKLKGIK